MKEGIFICLFPFAEVPRLIRGGPECPRRALKVPFWEPRVSKGQLCPTDMHFYASDVCGHSPGAIFVANALTHKLCVDVLRGPCFITFYDPCAGTRHNFLRPRTRRQATMPVLFETLTLIFV